MQIETFLDTLRRTPEAVDFNDTMAVIEANYSHQPTAFRNGNAENSADQNQGSCKLLAFARLHNLSPSETLACFGRFYREDVLQHPEASSHQNIRQFMLHGWAGVSFAGEPLSPRQ